MSLKYKKSAEKIVDLFYKIEDLKNSKKNKAIIPFVLGTFILFVGLVSNNVENNLSVAEYLFAVILSGLFSYMASIFRIYHLYNFFNIKKFRNTIIYEKIMPNYIYRNKELKNISKLYNELNEKEKERIKKNYSVLNSNKDKGKDYLINIIHVEIILINKIKNEEELKINLSEFKSEKIKKVLISAYLMELSEDDFFNQKNSIIDIIKKEIKEKTNQKFFIDKIDSIIKNFNEEKELNQKIEEDFKKLKKKESKKEHQFVKNKQILVGKI